MDELDAQVIVLRELVALQHGGPVEAVAGHAVEAVVPHALAQCATRVDGPVQTHGGEEGAEEDLGVRVAVYPDQRHPGASLLGHLAQGVVLEMVEEWGGW